MRAPSVSLSYSAGPEILAQIASRYQETTGAQKMLLLDRVVEMTGYARKYTIRLLNHLPESPTQIQRPRLPIYGSEVQEALFLAWKPSSIRVFTQRHQLGLRRKTRHNSFFLECWRDLF